jgi:Zn-dependent M28 family amino/carboxypeptidase
VGYGITAPEEKWDDWKGVDVRGKVALVMNNDPESDPALFAGKTRLYYGRWSYKYEEAARHGAAGVIIIHTEPSAGYPWQVVQSSWTGEQFELPEKEGEKRVALKMWAAEELAKRIAALGGKDLDALRKSAEGREFQPVPLGVKLSVGLSTKLRRLETANVVGRLAGSDPKLAEEAVVVTAHHDHLVIGEARSSRPGDVIYNGALDNATGVAALLATAEGLAAAKARPKRSVLFAAVAAEESGLIGSEYFCAHPPVPVGKLVANVNVDGFNIWGRTSDVTVVGMGKSTLDEVVKKAAAEQGREVVEDAFPEKGTFYRSDQFNFAKVGVPALYLKGGMKFLGRDEKWGRERVEEFVKERYHQPSDQVDETWRWDGAVDDVRLLAVVVLRVAEGKAAPEWRKGDEFEKVRIRLQGAPVRSATAAGTQK